MNIFTHTSSEEHIMSLVPYIKKYIADQIYNFHYKVYDINESYKRPNFEIYSLSEFRDSFAVELDIHKMYQNYFIIHKSTLVSFKRSIDIDKLFNNVTIL